MTAPRRAGSWELGEKLGKGGNATVWAAVHAETGEAAAVKLLNAKKRETERFLRFVREIETLAALGKFDGVLPVVDFSLPEGGAEDPWLAMPIATPIRDALTGQPLELVVEALQAVADTLARLAEEHSLGHRDIKPGNLYELDGDWLVGDFGLVDGMMSNSPHPERTWARPISRLTRSSVIPGAPTRNPRTSTRSGRLSGASRPERLGPPRATSRQTPQNLRSRTCFPTPGRKS
jgi:serine/threonine protein kinase